LSVATSDVIEARVMDFGGMSSAENLTWIGKRIGNVVRVCSKVYQTEVKNEQSATVLEDTNLQHARRNRTYNVASMPRSSSNLSSGKSIVCLTHDRGHPLDKGGEGFLQRLGQLEVGKSKKRTNHT
jgi:hypothetical protein